MGSVCLAVGVCLYVFSYKWGSLWKGCVRNAAFLFLTVASGVAVFKFANLPFMRPLNFEPLAHMIEEVGCFGAYIYGARYQRERLGNVALRPRLATALRTIPYVLAVCWLLGVVMGVSAFFGLLPRFEMTGMYQDLPTWSILYRGVILVPGFFICSLLAWVFIDRARMPGTDPRNVARFSLMSGGVLVFVFLTVCGMAWAFIQSYAPVETRYSWAGFEIHLEGALFALMGLFWLSSLAIPYRFNLTDSDIEDLEELRSRTTNLSEVLADAYAKIPQRHTIRDQIYRTGAELSLPTRDLLKVEKATSVFFALKDKRCLGIEEVVSIADRRERLLGSNLMNSSEAEVLAKDPLYEALRPAIQLAEESQLDLTNEQRWVKFTACVIDEVAPQTLLADVVLDEEFIHAFEGAR